MSHGKGEAGGDRLDNGAGEPKMARAGALVSLRYTDIPLPPSPFGEAQYLAGRRLVQEHGVRLEQLVWDADEVLWDWVMDVAHMLPRVPVGALTRSATHREFARLKPGVLELIWGLHHASLERGLDPHLRIWTNGYAWRLWRIALELPGLGELLGPPASGASTPADFAAHPRIFYRSDYVDVALALRRPGALRSALEGMSPAARAALKEQLDERPADSTLKLPELAPLAGKDGFSEARVLVDDEARNIRRFVASGRRGIQLVVPTYSILGGRVPNVVWRRPWRQLRALSTAVVPRLVEALARAFEPDGPSEQRVSSNAPVQGYVHRDFTYVVYDARVRGEWMVPRRRLIRAVRSESRS